MAGNGCPMGIILYFLKGFKGKRHLSGGLFPIFSAAFLKEMISYKKCRKMHKKSSEYIQNLFTILEICGIIIFIENTTAR